MHSQAAEISDGEPCAPPPPRPNTPPTPPALTTAPSHPHPTLSIIYISSHFSVDILSVRGKERWIVQPPLECFQLRRPQWIIWPPSRHNVRIYVSAKPPSGNQIAFFWPQQIQLNNVPESNWCVSCYGRKNSLLTFYYLFALTSVSRGRIPVFILQKRNVLSFNPIEAWALCQSGLARQTLSAVLSNEEKILRGKWFILPWAACEFQMTRGTVGPPSHKGAISLLLRGGLQTIPLRWQCFFLSVDDAPTQQPSDTTLGHGLFMLSLSPVSARSHADFSCVTPLT